MAPMTLPLESRVRRRRCFSTYSLGTYIKFVSPVHTPIKTNSSIAADVSEFLAKILTSIIPKGNPDFDDKIDLVNQWIVEFEGADKIPTREIGLDKYGQIIMIMPWKNNSGFWTDNNLKLRDFETSFETHVITKDEFENFWRTFEANQL